MSQTKSKLEPLIKIQPLISAAEFTAGLQKLSHALLWHVTVVLGFNWQVTLLAAELKRKKSCTCFYERENSNVLEWNIRILLGAYAVGSKRKGAEASRTKEICQ